MSVFGAKSFGIQFKDGSQVVYYRSTNIVPTEEGVHLVLGPADVNGCHEHIAIIETADIGEIFQYELEEAVA